MVIIVMSLAPFIAAIYPFSRELSWRITRIMCAGVLWACGAKLEVRNRSGLPDPPPNAIYVANHQSYLDVISLVLCMDGGFKFLAKRTLIFLPGINLILWGQNHFFVKRDEISKAIRALQKGAPKLLDSGEKIFIFPEGAISDDGIPREFKDGAAAVAIWSQAQIVPIAIIGSHKVLPKQNWPVTPGRILMIIGEPIPTEGKIIKARKQITEQLKYWIVQTISDERPRNES